MTLGQGAEPIEDVATPIVGYRWWNVNEVGQLFSTFRLAFEAWSSDGIRAHCGLLPDWLTAILGRQPPCVSHPLKPKLFGKTLAPPCGIYAYSEAGWGYNHRHGRVFGEVLVAGRIVPHEHGYRAEKATVSKLICTKPALTDFEVEHKVNLASERYDVPIEFIPEHELRCDG